MKGERTMHRDYQNASLTVMPDGFSMEPLSGEEFSGLLS